MNDETINNADEIVTVSKDEAVTQLKTAIRELGSGDGLTALTGGHGLQSRTFEFSWTSPTLAISFAMPYARVLDDDDVRQEDDANIGAACRLAILLIESDAAGALLSEGEAAMHVSFDRLAGAYYHTTDDNGEIIVSGDDWTDLVARFERVFQTNNDQDALSIIWP